MHAILHAKGEVTDAVRKQYSDLKKKEGTFAGEAGRKINVTRQTISNWELGETAPNPEQLILLSKQFDISIDELVGNDAMSSGSSRENKSIKDIYIGLIVLCGVVACVWAFSANRFRYVEILGITIAGAVVGACLGRVIHGILMYLRKDKK